MTQALAVRTETLPLPHFAGERAEQSVLGSMLIAGEACQVAVNMLLPHHFATKQHQWLFQSFIAIFQKTGGLNEVIAEAYLSKRKMEPEQRERLQAYLGAIQMNTPSAARIEEYCNIVLDAYEHREIENAVALLQKGIRDGVELRTLVPQFVDATNAILVERSHKVEAEAVSQEIEDEIEGRRMNIAIPGFPCLSTVKMFLPGCIAGLVGTPGSGKSMMLVEWFWRWEFCGVPVACLMLESGLAFHLRRCLAQLAARTELLDDVWCKSHPDEARSLRGERQAQIDRLEKTGTVQAMPRGATCAHLVRWMDQQFREGKKILGIDPLAAMSGQEKRFLDHEKLLGESQNLAEKYKGRVLYAMHPKPLGRGERRRPSLDQLPGSADFQKFLDACIWLSSHDALEGEFPKLDEYGYPDKAFTGLKYKHDYNRTITVIKKRRAGGWMPVIGANMDSKTLWTSECGWL